LKHSDASSSQFGSSKLILSYNTLNCTYPNLTVTYGRDLIG